MAREFIELAQVYIIPAYSDEKIHVYLARGFSPSRQNLDQEEILQVVKHTFDEVLMMIGQGLLTEALTILSPCTNVHSERPVDEVLFAEMDKNGLFAM